MWICSSHTKGKFQDSNPDPRSDLPILAQGLPAVFLAGLPAVIMAGCFRKMWLLGDKFKPSIIGDADKAFH
jgi:hypothetical protein